MDKKKIGILIKNKRKEKQINQKQLAALLNVSDTAVSKWENGVNLPDIQNLEPLSKLLDIPIQIFLGADLPVHNHTSADNDSPTGNELSADKDIPASNDSADCRSPTDENLPSQSRPPMEATPVIPDPETASTIKAPDKSENNAALPEKKPATPRKFLPVKIKWWQMAASFSIFLLVGTVIVYQARANTNNVPAFTITEEYYDNYGDQKAYYLIIDYTGLPNDETLMAYEESLRKTYSNYFSECNVIVVAYIENDNFHKNMNISDSADFLTVLYPMLPQ